MVFNRATESAAKIILSSSFWVGSLKNIWSIGVCCVDGSLPIYIGFVGSNVVYGILCGSLVVFSRLGFFYYSCFDIYLVWRSNDLPHKVQWYFITVHWHFSDVKNNYMLSLLFSSDSNFSECVRLRMLAFFLSLCL